MNKPIRASTQEHLDIHVIKDDLIVLKTGACAKVLQTTAINFDLLSEEEQNAIMYAYAGLLNSLQFPTQILVRSQRKDITDYLDLLDQNIQETSSQKIKESMIRYRRFIKSLVREKRVLEKKFYVVVHFSAIELGVSANTFNPLAKRPDKPPYDTDYIIQKAKMSLIPRKDHIIRQFNRIGLKAHELNTQDLIDLFYHAYNLQSFSRLNTPLPQREPKISIRSIFSRKT